MNLSGLEAFAWHKLPSAMAACQARRLLQAAVAGADSPRLFLA
jgi:hypothetical protein